MKTDLYPAPTASASMTSQSSQAKTPLQTGTTMCPYCGVGCHVDVDINLEDNTVVNVKGTRSSPVSRGQLCPKGALLAPVLSLPGRLKQPLIRDEWIAPQHPTSWDHALSEVAQRLAKIITAYGPDSVALYGSGQLDTESWYLGNKLFKGFIGSNHVDSNSRLCMASAVASYRNAFGSDAPPTCYDDIEHADVFLITGSNMADTHPVTFQRIRAFCASHKDQTTLIVVDPRQTHTTQSADIHLQIKPGSDIALHNALAKRLIELGGVDDKFISASTNHFQTVRSALEALDMAALLETCGITSEMLEQVAQKIRNAKGFLSFYCMGLGQSTSGTMKCQSLINLHLLTGQIGKTGSGPFSMTGQPNAMGGREVGGLAHLLPGYRLIENETHRHEVEDVWGVARGSIRPKNGLTAVEIFQGLESGRIKAVWIVCNNAMVSLPNLDQVRRALGKAELIVAQDCFETETTHIAHIVLPAAQWIERTSTMTNSERRVSRNPQLAKPYFQSKPDWWIFSEVAKRLGFENAFSYRNSEEIWDEFRTLTRGRPCDMFGMTNERLAQAPLQWPCPTVDHPGTPRRYTDKKFATPDGKANFVVAHYQPPAELPSSEYPLVLSTGRLASQWHTMTRTGKVARLKKQLPEAFIEMSPSDASELNLRADDEVWVQSARGEARVRIKLSNKQRPGNVFMPFHWGGMFAPGGEANNLTNSAFDPISKEPEYKVCAVRLVPKN